MQKTVWICNKTGREKRKNIQNCENSILNCCSTYMFSPKTILNCRSTDTFSPKTILNCRSTDTFFLRTILNCRSTDTFSLKTILNCRSTDTFSPKTILNCRSTDTFSLKTILNYVKIILKNEGVDSYCSCSVFYKCSSIRILAGFWLKKRCSGKNIRLLTCSVGNVKERT